MEWKTDMLYHGFRLVEEKALDDIHSLAKVFYHEKSGAKLFFLENEDDNKVFSVSFRTPPENNTGTPHIVEHSVLCGSRKFPVSKPFVELAKGSLKTFLNALTFSDKTMYPIASRNKQDFHNLMEVYLDAVFYPNIYTCSDIFQQEGWHYELENAEAALTYKGVVYNEMQGAFSAPETILESKIVETLFPDTIYRFVAGGLPEAIPKLTREKFLEFHTNYYHPSNAYIFLYGDTDILAQLQFIDEEYLSKFTKKAVNSQIAKQQAFGKRVERVYEYSVGKEEATTGKTLLSMNFVVGDSCDAELVAAFSILTELLLNSQAAPLKNALLAAGLGKNVQGNFNNSRLQPTLSIVVTGTNESAKKSFVQIIERELSRLVTRGIDKKLIEAAINSYEFSLREANYGYPKGLVYNMICLESWLHDESPLSHFAYTAILDKIRTALTDNYFEQLIEKYLLSNSHQSLVVLSPKPGLAEKESQALRKELAEYKASLSPCELRTLLENMKDLKVRQQTPDSPQALASLPLLGLGDLPTKAPVIPVSEKQEAGSKVLFQPLQTAGIVYAALYFDTQRVPQQYLSYVYLLARLVGQVSTEKYNYMDLANEIHVHTGGIVSYISNITQVNNSDAYCTKFVVRAKVLAAKLLNLTELLQEIINHSSFADNKLMLKLIREIKSDLDMSLFSSGQEIANNRVLAYFSPAAQHEEHGMLGFYEFITDLEQNYAAKSTEIAENLASVARLIFARNNLVASVTLDQDNYPLFQSAFSSLFVSLPMTEAPLQDYQLELAQTNEGLMAAGQVQYVVKAANFRKAGYAYHGSLKVAENILSLDYLWNRVRVLGGAYGCRASVQRNGNMLFTSYRDPNLKETLAIYHGADDYLRKTSFTERELTKYIIGAINRLDPALTAEQKGNYAANCYFQQLSQQAIQKEWEEVLATSRQDIRKAADVVGLIREQNYLCVFGNEQKIRENKAVFNQIKHVSK